jgi:hypothetical protein
MAGRSGRGSGWRRISAATVVGAMLGGQSAWTGPVMVSAGTGPSVLVVGDSLAADATDELRDELARHGYRTAGVVAYGGTDIGWAADRLAEGVPADIVVVATGTNAAGGGWSATDAEHTATAIRRMTRWPCPLWVVPATFKHTIGIPSARDPESAATAAGIRRAVSAAGIASVEWATVADGRRDLHQWDGIHHNAAGQQAYAELVAAGIDHHCSPGARSDRETHERYVDRAFVAFLGRAAGSAESTAWTDRLVSGQRATVLSAMLSTSAERSRRSVSELYGRILRRAPDAGGLQHWSGTLLAGQRVVEVAAALHGSAELYRRVGSSPEAYVTALYREILGREPDPGGHANWSAAVRSGQSRSVVAGAFYASAESRRQRVVFLYRQLVGVTPTEAAIHHWSVRLVLADDGALAEALVASDRFVRMTADP